MRKEKVMNIDQDRMQQVAQDAFDRASGNRRWETAIAKAKAQLESNPYIHFDGKSLLILSPSSEIYTANGTCQCKAYQQGQPCWHRAAARLVERYNETSH
jgi:SWIM zinc finger